jgi:hypothetical protein
MATAPKPEQGDWVQVGDGWVPSSHPLAQSPSATPGGAAPAGPGQITTAGQVASATAPAGGSIAPGAPTTVAGAFQQALVSKMAPQPISASNPQVAPALAANRISEQRGMERDRNILAERAAASGTNMSGGFDTSLLGLSQARSEREGQFAGDKLWQLGQQQSGEGMGAMQMAGGLLSGEAQRELQKYGIDTDAALRDKGLGIQEKLGTGQLGLGLLGQQIGDQQFGQGLGAQIGMFSAGQYQDALLRLLGGL